MIHYKPVKIIIDITGLAKIIVNVVITHHGFPKSIIDDEKSLFITKF